ncbi:MAG: hypothetical protein HY093_02725 [Candidatus Liptonbacteria bacterium]|nr:hypothetical protein [Candidatus Liptonbacteria bacterium]
MERISGAALELTAMVTTGMKAVLVATRVAQVWMQESAVMTETPVDDFSQIRQA